MKNLNSYLFVLLMTISLLAQVPDMVTDRPDQTESSITVPNGWIQIETGTLKEKDSPQKRLEFTNIVYNTTLLRYGLFDKTEMRFGWEYLNEYILSGDMEADATGIAPLVVGFKTQISEENGWVPELAFLGHLTIPNVGKDEFQTDYLTPEFRFAGTKTLNENFTAAINLGGEWVDAIPNTNIFYSFVIGMGVNDKISAFAEIYGYVIKDFNPDHRFDTGFTYLINNNFQIDLSAGIGINDKAPDYFISGGLSFRLNLKSYNSLKTQKPRI
ncbi:MAG: transporter [Candidatus Marinimicrobia bacterium]|nr:transporter [Candidatus Neomarinimicrobiota bacterium]